MSQRSSESWAKTPKIPAEPTHVDVLITTCDRPAELGVTLAGLAAQREPSFRVVVSDQSEQQPAWQHPAPAAMMRVLQAQGREVVALRHLPRRGMAEHRHFLLEQARTGQCLFLDDDIWLESGALQRMDEVLQELGCGFVGMAPQGLSFLPDRRPHELVTFERWDGAVTPERIRPETAGFKRWQLHNAANLSHLAADLELQPGESIPYRVAWLGGCVLYDRQKLEDVGGFSFWNLLPPEHCGEDVVAEWRVMEKFGGAGILPSGTVHLESPTTVTDRRVEAYTVVLREDAGMAERDG